MAVAVKIGRLTRMIRNQEIGLIILLAFSAVSCKREIVVTDTAEVKRIEASEKRATSDALLAAQTLELSEKSESRRAEAEKASVDLQKAEAERLAARDTLLTAETKQMEQEAQLAREKLTRERMLADQKKALDEEVSAIASASNTINVFVADMRSRQGRLQLKMKSLPNEIEQARADAAYLRSVLSSCCQGVVTNVRYALNGRAKLTDIQTVTRYPDEYVKSIKADPKISSILTRYNNEMFAFELDKVVAELAYEKKRLDSSWQMLTTGTDAYSFKLAKANAGTGATKTEFKGELDKVENRIKALTFQIRALQNGFQDPSVRRQILKTSEELGQDGAEPTGLYAERQRVKQMMELASNTEQHADASSSGITSNFALQKKGLRDEYEANVRRAFDNVERSVLHTVTEKKDSLDQELTSVRSDLASIQLILDAHANGQISRNDMLNLHSKFTNSVSESLSSATDRILKRLEPSTIQ